MEITLLTIIYPLLSVIIGACLQYLMSRKVKVQETPLNLKFKSCLDLSQLLI